MNDKLGNARGWRHTGRGLGYSISDRANVNTSWPVKRGLLHDRGNYTAVAHGRC